MTKQHNSLMFCDLGPFLPNGLSTINETRLISFRTHFYHSTSLDSPTTYLNIFLPINPHIVKKSGSWTNSLGLYLEPVMIQLDLLPTNFQPTVMSYIFMNSLRFFLSRLNLLPTNFQTTMKSFSHYPFYETKSKDSSPPKISRAIILFLFVDSS